MRVDNKHSEPGPRGLLERKPDALCRSLRVLRQHQNYILTFYVGVVHAGVGAYETQAVFDDDQPQPDPQHLLCF